MKKYDKDISRDVLTLMRVQKHDQLNHLQVILGYLQLDKKDEALEYTKTAISETQKNGLIMKLETSNLALLIMNRVQEAKEIGTEITLEVNTRFEKIIEDDVLCDIVDKIWESVKSQIARCEYYERALTISLCEKDNYYILMFKFPFTDNNIFNKELEIISEEASFRGLKFVFENDLRFGIASLHIPY